VLRVEASASGQHGGARPLRQAVVNDPHGWTALWSGASRRSRPGKTALPAYQSLLRRLGRYLNIKENAQALAHLGAQLLEEFEEGHNMER
jgi:hypothetical protein